MFCGGCSSIAYELVSVASEQSELAIPNLLFGRMGQGGEQEEPPKDTTVTILRGGRYGPLSVVHFLSCPIT